MKLRGRMFILAATLLTLVACSSTTPPAEAPKDAAPDAAVSADVLTGTWMLNVSKSTYSPAALAPKSGKTVMEASDDGIKVVTDGVNSKGQRTTTDYTAKFDGVDVPTNGTVDGKPNPDADSVSWKKIDDHNYEIANKLKGQVMSTLKIAVAPDGKSRINTTTGKNAAGQTINNMGLMEKQ